MLAARYDLFVGFVFIPVRIDEPISYRRFRGGLMPARDKLAAYRTPEGGSPPLKLP